MADVEPSSKRTYLSQADVPARPLTEALRIAQAIADNFGKQATRPLRVAEALDLAPSSSHFRMLCGASIAYGLTIGGYNAQVIELTELGRRVIAPTDEGDDTRAMREALLLPRVMREFLTKYNGSRLPASRIAANVLEELGVPSNRTDSCVELILESARSVGFIREVKGNSYVDLDVEVSDETGTRDADHDNIRDQAIESSDAEVDVHTLRQTHTNGSAPERRQGSVELVFITHGKAMNIVDQLKELLTFGGFKPVVAIEEEGVSKSVPEKVLNGMRRCQAAIIHVGTEETLIDANGDEHSILNQNVLIEIGAAMALYGRNFILLVEDGVKLPSNLQGLYEVRFAGTELGYEATMKLLKSFNDFRG